MMWCRAWTCQVDPQSAELTMYNEWSGHHPRKDSCTVIILKNWSTTKTRGVTGYIFWGTMSRSQIRITAGPQITNIIVHLFTISLTINPVHESSSLTGTRTTYFTHILKIIAKVNFQEKLCKVSYAHYHMKFILREHKFFSDGGNFSVNRCTFDSDAYFQPTASSHWLKYRLQLPHSCSDCTALELECKM